MFTNLIESESHRREFKRRSSFFLITVAAYVVILFAAGVASIYAYDAHLDALSNDLSLISWVPPVTPATHPPEATRPQPVRTQRQSNAPVDRNVTTPIRTDAIAPISDPTKVPDNVGTKASTVPPVTGAFKLGDRNVDPPSINTKDGCVTCSGTGETRVVIDEKPPEPPVVKPPTTQRVASTVLTSKAVSLPQPPYPSIARQLRLQGAVNVQILVDEQGKVLSAQVVNGHPTLAAAARDAAMRARFTPTVLNGQPVKIQGVITYNFVMQ